MPGRTTLSSKYVPSIVQGTPVTSPSLLAWRRTRPLPFRFAMPIPLAPHSNLTSSTSRFLFTSTFSNHPHSLSEQIHSLSCPERELYTPSVSLFIASLGLASRSFVPSLISTSHGLALSTPAKSPKSPNPPNFTPPQIQPPRLTTTFLRST